MCILRFILTGNFVSFSLYFVICCNADGLIRTMYALSSPTKRRRFVLQVYFVDRRTTWSRVRVEFRRLFAFRYAIPCSEYLRIDWSHLASSTYSNPQVWSIFFVYNVGISSYLRSMYILVTPWLCGTRAVQTRFGPRTSEYHNTQIYVCGRQSIDIAIVVANTHFDVNTLSGLQNEAHLTSDVFANASTISTSIPSSVRAFTAIWHTIGCASTLSLPGFKVDQLPVHLQSRPVFNLGY
jgi:hypothetical protein